MSLVVPIDDLEVACFYCGCTADAACETPDGPCAWVSEHPPVCSHPECQAWLLRWLALASVLNMAEAYGVRFRSPSLVLT